MILRNFMLADAVSWGEGGKFFIHGGGLSGVEAEVCPVVQARIDIFATLEVESSDESGKSVDFSIEVQAADGEVIRKVLSDTLELPYGDHSSDPRMSVFHILLSVTGASFDDFGAYWFVLSLDGTEASRLPFLVENSGSENDPE